MCSVQFEVRGLVAVFGVTVLVVSGLSAIANAKFLGRGEGAPVGPTADLI